jgi:hypothetical protein
VHSAAATGTTDDFFHEAAGSGPAARRIVPSAAGDVVQHQIRHATGARPTRACFVDTARSGCERDKSPELPHEDRQRPAHPSIHGADVANVHGDHAVVARARLYFCRLCGYFYLRLRHAWRRELRRCDLPTESRVPP